MKKLIFIMTLVLLLTMQAFAYKSAFDIEWGRDVTSSLPSNTLMQWAEGMEGRVGGVNLGTGSIFYVDSGVTNEGDGSSWTNAKNTLAEGIALCTANRGDVVYVAPGHAESLAASVAVNIAGVTIVGCGSGSDRPTFTYTGTAGALTVSVASVTIDGLRFAAGISAVVTAIDVAAGGDYLTVQNCEFVSPGTATYEFYDMITLATGSDYVTIRYNKFVSVVGTTGCNQAIDADTGIVNRLTIAYNEFQGNFAVAAVHSSRVNTNCLIIGNTVHQATSGQFAIEFTAAATGLCIGNTMYTDAVATALDPGSMACIENYTINTVDLSATLVPAVPAIGTVTAGSADDILKKLYYTSDGTDAYPATVANDSTIAKIMASGATATASTFDNTTDSLQAISDKITALTGIFYTGTAATNATTTTVISTGLSGYGDAFFVTDWVMVCTYDAGGAAGAPEGEIRDITAYTSSTGTFTVAAFSAAVTAGDKVMVVRREEVALVTFAAGTDVYPAGVTDDSIIAMILSKSATAAASSYSNATDSLEMLSDKLGAFAGTAGAAAGESLYADIALAQTDLDAILADTAAADTKAELVVLAGTAEISTTGVTGAPTANTLADTLHKDGNFTYDNTTDALEAIADQVEYSASKTCTAAGGLANGTNNLFAIAGGPVEVVSLTGIVTNDLKTVANACKFIHTTTTPAGSVDLTSAVECSGDVAGTSYICGATLGAALVPTTAGTIASSALTFIAPIGTIGFNAAGTFDASDSITFYVRYKPLISGARVTAAP